MYCGDEGDGAEGEEGEAGWKGRAWCLEGAGVFLVLVEVVCWSWGRVDASLGGAVRRLGTIFFLRAWYHDTYSALECDIARLGDGRLILGFG